MPQRKHRWRRLALALPTLVGFSPRGFFIPSRHAAAGPGPGGATYPELEPYFRAAEPAFASLLAAVARHEEELSRIGDEGPPTPRWDQDWFPRLDAAAAYALIRTRAPGRIVEIGSGHSTRWFARAVADGRLPTRVTTIDPAPRATFAGSRIVHVRATVQQAGSAPFVELRPGDLVSLDGSHVLMPGTDTDFVLNRVLPGLPAGALVHVHDIFLPDDYPAAWAWRGYNEQLGVAGLLHGGGWRLIWSSRWVATRMRECLESGLLGRLPLPAGAHETSLWLEKTGFGRPGGRTGGRTGTGD